MPTPCPRFRACRRETGAAARGRHGRRRRRSSSPTRGGGLPARRPGGSVWSGGVRRGRGRCRPRTLRTDLRTRQTAAPASRDVAGVGVCRQGHEQGTRCGLAAWLSEPPNVNDEAADLEHRRAVGAGYVPGRVGRAGVDDDDLGADGLGPDRVRGSGRSRRPRPWPGRSPTTGWLLLIAWASRTWFGNRRPSLERPVESRRRVRRPAPRPGRPQRGHGRSGGAPRRSTSACPRDRAGGNDAGILAVEPRRTGAVARALAGQRPERVTRFWCVTTAASDVARVAIPPGAGGSRGRRRHPSEYRLESPRRSRTRRRRTATFAVWA